MKNEQAERLRVVLEELDQTLSFGGYHIIAMASTIMRNTGQERRDDAATLYEIIEELKALERLPELKWVQGYTGTSRSDTDRPFPFSDQVDMLESALAWCSLRDQPDLFEEENFLPELTRLQSEFRNGVDRCLQKQIAITKARRKNEIYHVPPEILDVVKNLTGVGLMELDRTVQAAKKKKLKSNKGELP